MRRWIPVLAMTFLAFLIYEVKAFSTDLLYGIDGPYYYVQVRSILERGHMLYPDPPLAFYLLTAFSPLGITAGIKVGSILFIVLGALPTYLLVREMTNDLGGYAAAAFYLFNPWLIRMSMDLIKNAMGLTFLSFTIALAYLAVKRGDVRYAWASAVFITLTGLTHVLDFGVAILILLGLLIYTRSKELIPPLAVAAVLLTLGFTTGIMGGDPYKGVALIEQVSSNSQPRRPPKLGNRNWVNLAYSLVLALTGMVLSLKLKGLERGVTLTTSTVLLIMNLPFIPGNFLWRFDLMTAVLAPVVVGALIGEVRDVKLALAMSLLLFGILAPMSWNQLNSIRPSVPEAELREIREVVQRFSGRYTLVVPNPRLLYWVQTMDLDAVRRLEEAKPPALIVADRRVPVKGNILFKGRFITVILPTPKAGP